MKHLIISENGRINKKVIFLLTGWQNKLWHFWLPSKILSLNGFYCITYVYNNDILSPDTAKTADRLTEVKKDILKKIQSFKKDGYNDYFIFGTSLGSMIALMVANNTTDISKVILNLSGIDPAEAVWTWNDVFPWFKKALIKQSMTLAKLKKVWAPISTINNTNNLKNKKILVYLSEKDEIIPFNQGMQLVKEFERRKYNYKLITNKSFKHILTGLYNLINARPYLKFLNS